MTGHVITANAKSQNITFWNCPNAIVVHVTNDTSSLRPDMRYGLDPNFRFTLARSIYKTVLRFVNEMHGEKSVVQPLALNTLSTPPLATWTLTTEWW